MAWGILEDPKALRPPGTILIDDINLPSMLDASKLDYVHLKKDGNTILQPQPSDSVNDPLNWPSSLKFTIIFILITSSVAVGGMMSMLMTAGRILSERYHTTFPKLISQLTPPAVATSCVALFFTSAISVKFGKRIGLVIGAFGLWFNVLTGYWANSIHYYRNIGIVASTFAAPGELLLGPILIDLIFVHQRGRLMAISSIISVIGMDASHIISGNIIAKLGVKYLYMISFAVMAPFAILIYLFVWETTYHRATPSIQFQQNDTLDLPNAGNNNHEKLKSPKDETSTSDSNSFPNSNTVAALNAPSKYKPPTQGTPDDPKLSFRQQLKVFRKPVSERSFFKALLQPFSFMMFPSVIYCTIVGGAFFAWLVISGTVSQQVLLYPPYNIKPDTMAYLSLPGSGVGLISAVVAGYLSDFVIKVLAKRNNGIYEPEYRLLLMIPATIFTTAAFLITGPFYAKRAPVWKILVSSSLLHVGSPFATSATVTYIFDTMGAATTEAFVVTTIFKGISIYFATSYVPTWFQRSGAVKVYNTLAIMSLGFGLLTVPMYVFGKRMRGAVSRNKLLGKISASATENR